MKINNHEPITKRNDVTTDKYSVDSKKNSKYVLISFFHVSFEIVLKINIKNFINKCIDTLFQWV